MTANEICDRAGVDDHDRFVIEKVYKNQSLSVEEWNEVGKDFRSYKSVTIPTEEPQVEESEEPNSQTTN